MQMLCVEKCDDAAATLKSGHLVTLGRFHNDAAASQRRWEGDGGAGEGRVRREGPGDGDLRVYMHICKHICIYTPTWRRAPGSIARED